MSGLRPNRVDNLRPAPAGLTPEIVDRFLGLADRLSSPCKFPLDASVTASGRTVGDVHAPLVAAEEAGRDIPGRKSLTAEQKIIAAMRAAQDTRWTMSALSKAAGLTPAKTKTAVQSMRWSGKMPFDRLALSGSLLAEARSIADKRITGQTAVLDRRPANAAEAVAAALGENISDAMIAIQRRWPDLWWGIIARARSTGERPGVVFAEVVERGLATYQGANHAG